MPPKRTILRDLRHDLELATRFWAKVTRPVDSDCWLWSGANDSRSGYGHLNVDGAFHKAHRIAWALARGHVPEGLQVLHRCDNPPCVRPNHLYIGTRSANMREMWIKGRHARVGKKGEACRTSKLTNADVRQIRSMGESGATLDAIAVQFSVTPSNVSQILRRKTWTHI